MKFLWSLFASTKEIAEVALESAPATSAKRKIADLPPGELKDLATKLEKWLSGGPTDHVYLADIPIFLAQKLLEEKK